jgi:hypothetical protein
LIDYLEYNSNREKLRIPEYGRHIQKLVDKAIEIQDDEERQRAAESIVAVMGSNAPHLKDVSDYQNKLWDQLFIISDFKLNVNSPYKNPSPEKIFEQPETLNYPENIPSFRYYGNNIKKMIDAACKMEDGELKEGLIYTIANHMKKCYLNWNRDAVKDSIIFKHLEKLSGGQIKLNSDNEELIEASDLVKTSPKKYTKSNKKRHKKSNRKKFR